LDISNIQVCQHKNYINKISRSSYHNYFEYFILVAVSRVDVDKDMKGAKNEDTESKCNYKRGYLGKRIFRKSDDGNKKFKTKCDEVNINMQNETKRGTAIYRFKVTKDIKNDTTSTVTVVEDDTKNKIKKENYVIDENSIVYYYVSDN